MKVTPRIRRVLGCLLLLSAMVVGFLWFYWLAPFRHWSSYVWLGDRSPRVQWAELQKFLRRHPNFETDIGAPLHFSSDQLGQWGGKEWAEWLITRMKKGKSYDGCTRGHLEVALSDITNQGDEFDANTWISWWTTNCYRTQVAWIRDGFRIRGVELQEPLTTENTLALLNLAFPARATNSVARSNYPSTSLRFNAKHWLRDAGFRAAKFDLALVPADQRGEVTRRLTAYAEWAGGASEFPSVLPSRGQAEGQEVTAKKADQYKWMNRTPEKWLPLLIIVMCTGLGILLLRRASKLDKPSTGDGIR